MENNFIITLSESTILFLQFGKNGILNYNKKIGSIIFIGERND